MAGTFGSRPFNSSMLAMQGCALTCGRSTVVAAMSYAKASNQVLTDHQTDGFVSVSVS